MRKTGVLVAAATLFSSALVVWSSPAEAITGPVDIRVEHDLDLAGSGPRVLEVTGVTPGAGPEITVADEIDNPSGWGGNVLVDIDPDAETITVEVEDSNCYDTVLVQITTDEIGSVAVLSDGIYDPEDSPVSLTTSVGGGVVTLAWESEAGDCPGFDVEGSQSVFSYGSASVPTASISAAEVEQGDPVTVTGTACPGGTVLVDVLAEAPGLPLPVGAEVEADEAGDWSYEIDTTDLEPGSYGVQASCTFVEGQGFDYEVLAFEVSAEPVAPAPPAEPVAAAASFTG